MFLRQHNNTTKVRAEEKIVHNSSNNHVIKVIPKTTVLS